MPPIFPGPQIEAGSHQYLHRARMFRDAMVGRPQYVNGETNWPYYAMLTHAIELALKAYVQHQAPGGLEKGSEPRQHDLSGWYKLAVDIGLSDDVGVLENVDLLNELHSTHYTRYPQKRAVPDADVIADETVDHLLQLVTQKVSPR